MTDRELLELAAKAAVITIKPVEIKNVEFAGDDRFIGYSTDPHEWLRGWFNPLTDDGDALRLAVRLGLKVLIDLDEGATRIHNVYDGLVCMHMHFDGDPYAATRRAIVRAAAAIGEQMK